MPTLSKRRTFKTARFAKDARKAGVLDDTLCELIAQVVAGQADDLGGGVYKKRLHDNMLRSIILAKGGEYWIYEYLFAKSKRDNIDADELTAFRLLAKSYAGLTHQYLGQLLAVGDFVEICHDKKTKI